MFNARFDTGTIHTLEALINCFLHTYYKGILNYLINLNLLIKSVRVADVDILIAVFEMVCKLIFALEHIHYSRWLPVLVDYLKGFRPRTV